MYLFRGSSFGVFNPYFFTHRITCSLKWNTRQIWEVLTTWDRFIWFQSQVIPFCDLRKLNIVCMCSISNRNKQMLSLSMFFQNILCTLSMHFVIGISKPFKESNWSWQPPCQLNKHYPHLTAKTTEVVVSWNAHNSENLSAFQKPL